MNLSMDGINDIMRKRLSIQHRGKNMIGSLAMNEIKSYLGVKRVDLDVENEVLNGYVRHNKLFLKTNDQRLKIQIFKEKLNIILSVNRKLSDVGYKMEIKDIVFK